MSLPKSKDDKIKANSTLYKYLKGQKDEIDRYKYLESERLGYDIGWDKALLGWIKKTNRPPAQS